MIHYKTGFILIISILTFVVTFPLISSAQDFNEISKKYSEKRLIQEMHIVAGPSLNFLRGTPAVDNNSQNERKILTGHSVGLMFRSKKFLNNFNVTATILYELKGGTSHTVGTYFDTVDQTMKKGITEFKRKYFYFSLPLRIEYVLFNDKLKIEAGGFISYLNKNIREVKDLYKSKKHVREIFDETHRHNRFDYGYSFGVGYQIPISRSKNITISLINNLGIYNIGKDLYPGLELKTNSTLLSFSLAI